MKILQLMSLFLVGLVLTSGCKKDKDPVIWPDLQEGLVLTIQEEYTTLPAKVSVFFKVETKDGDPVAGLGDENFTIFEKGKNDDAEKLISEDEAKRRISSRQQIFAYSTLLVLDLSGSVTNNYLNELKEASKSFIDQVMPNEAENNIQMMIMWFDGDDDLHLLEDLTPNKAELKAAIDDIHDGMSNDNSTDLYGAVMRANLEAERLLQNTSDVNTAASIVIFTDGTDQAGRHNKQDAYNTVNNADDVISFYTIGLGSEIDVDVLQNIGKDAFAFAAETEELVNTFEEIANKVNAEANSYYLFEYCSPKRDGSGISDLRIQAKHDGLTGDVRTTFDATGFDGGCNL